MNDSRTEHSLNQRLDSKEETDGHIFRQLNLTLASSSLQVKESPSLTMMPQLDEENGQVPESRFNVNTTTYCNNILQRML
ncbi:hypothetical protein V6N13_083140 [Hibiscus sabdariffa]|uniref:Uncharacterized protein n=1 Tax=Hibiscus sabdariffa TaxID=183260 RepID=A0ABR2SX39_9ROSI